MLPIKKLLCSLLGIAQSRASGCSVITCGFANCVSGTTLMSRITQSHVSGCSVITCGFANCVSGTTLMSGIAQSRVSG